MVEPELNEKQRQVVAWIVGGMPGPQAFRKAGYSSSYSRKSATVLKRLAYLAAIEHERATLHDQLPYSVVHAVKEIDRQIRLALSAKNPNFMAAAKNLDLKCRIYNLVREKIDITTVDLRGSLENARNRVLNILSPVQPADARAINWTKNIPGSGAESNP